MRIYLSLQNAWFAKNLRPVVATLLDRGHEVVIGLCEQGQNASLKESFGLAGRQLTVTNSPVRSDGWATGAEQLRQVIDYLHFLDPRFDRIAYSRVRRRGEVSELAHRLIRQYRLRYGLRRRAALWWLQRVEESLPADPALVRHYQEYRPDAVILCPLLGPEVAQYEHLRAATSIGIPSAYAVHSWDNLSSKGLIRMRPDRVLVWNEVQRNETTGLHRQPRGRVVVSGAYPYDDWFETEPSMNRVDFLRTVGLSGDAPIILYLCSALYFPKAQPEAAFVREWLRRLRAADDPRLREAGIVIRPHPKRAAEFTDHSLPGDDPLAVVWPARGEMPTDAGRHRTFFDSLYHADAVVGLNTSAMIEAAILGHSVHTILDPRYEISQQDTFHFGYLSNAERGVLRVAESWDEHLNELSKSLAGERDAKRAKAFVEVFVRPRRGKKPSDVMVSAIEGLARAKRTLPLLGTLMRRYTLPWLERMQGEAKSAEQEVTWSRCQTLVQWQERREFLSSLKRVSPGACVAGPGPGHTLPLRGRAR